MLQPIEKRYNELRKQYYHFFDQLTEELFHSDKDEYYRIDEEAQILYTRMQEVLYMSALLKQAGIK